MEKKFVYRGKKESSLEERKKAHFPEVDAVATLSLRDCDQLGGAGSGLGQHDACCLSCFYVRSN